MNTKRTLGRSRLIGLAIPLAAALLAMGCDSGLEPAADDGIGVAMADKQAQADKQDQMAEQDQMLAEKKQMLMDQGYSAEQIATLLGPNGGGDVFKDDVVANRDAPETIADLKFVKPSDDNPRGESVRLTDFLGNQKIVLVVTRGYSGGSICPFCATQTAQLAANYKKFKDLGAEVLIVYPGAPEHLDDFLKAATNKEQASVDDVKWSVLMDPDQSAVKLLDIAADLASPSTFIFDREGNVTFAYVGVDQTDRPSVQALLTQLEQI